MKSGGTDGWTSVGGEVVFGGFFLNNLRVFVCFAQQRGRQGRVVRLTLQFVFQSHVSAPGSRLHQPE